VGKCKGVCVRAVSGLPEMGYNGMTFWTGTVTININRYNDLPEVLLIISTSPLFPHLPSGRRLSAKLVRNSSLVD
jgi:hypothetical protein